MNREAAVAALAALPATLVLLFAWQGQAILQQPLGIALLAVPILSQVLFNAGLARGLNRRPGETHRVACPSAPNGASRCVERAVAAPIRRSGLQAGAAPATVVGVRIVRAVLLRAVHVVNRRQGWYEAGLAPPAR